MDRAIGENAISYYNLGNYQLSEIDFISVQTNSIEPVVSQGYSSFFNREEYDQDDFAKQMLKLIGADNLAFDTWVIICHYEGQQVECLGYIYLKDFQIIPVRFTSSVNFDAWIRVLSEKFDQSKDIIFTIAKSSFSISTSTEPDASKDWVKFLQKNAPRFYTKERKQRAKQQYLARFRQLDGTKQTINLVETQRLWKAFKALTDLDNSSSGATAESFEQFQSTTGVIFPPELQVIYQANDGVPSAFLGLDLMPLSRVIAEWQSWKNIFDDWSLEDLTGNNYSDRNKTLGMYTNPYWVPFIDNISGNFFGIDLMPNQAGKIGQIISFGADTDEITCIADNLNHLLALSIAAIETPEPDNPLVKHFRLMIG
jgi:cell wall assembly regulator SMI1